MSIQESLDQVIQSLSDKPIYQILITKLVPNMLITEYDGRKYILINNIDWLRMEQELASLFKTIPAEQRSISYYSGIPVYENEQLVKEILQHVLSEIGFFNKEIK